MIYFSPDISFGAVGSAPISQATMWSNFCVMLISEAILSDALVAFLSRSGWINGAKVDLAVRGIIYHHFSQHTNTSTHSLPTDPPPNPLAARLANTRHGSLRGAVFHFGLSSERRHGRDHLKPVLHQLGEGVRRRQVETRGL